MIDFTPLERKNKTYAGANGSKISVIYNGEQYMLKFPPSAKKNTERNEYGTELDDILYTIGKRRSYRKSTRK